MKNKIRHNLILRVDYEREKTIGGILLNKHRFYLIGILCTLLIYDNGKKEIAKLMVKEEIPIGDPKLKSLIGVKATDLIRVKKYEIEINILTLKLEKVLKAILSAKSFNKKSLKDIRIIKIE